MEEVYNVPSKKIRVSRLGTHQFALARKSTHGILRILTCSDVVPVKRIDRMISSLSMINSIPIRRTHIGEGYLQNRILELSRDLPSNIVFDFKGGITPRQVSDYYAENEIDVLINTSESEGIPVSVMEALSAGVPVIATNVGGTSEIVDGSMGRLLPGDFGDSDLSTAIVEFYRLTPEQREGLQAASLQRFRERCNAHSQDRELCSILIQ